MSPTSQPPLPPYALAPARFRFPALASAAGRAAIGHGREVALATYVVARLVDDTRPERGLAEAARSARAQAARAWLAALALPANLRVPLARLVDATGTEAGALRAPLEGVITLTAPFLETAALSELQRLATAVAR